MNAVAKSALLGLVLISVLSACSSLSKPMKAYEGPLRPVTEVAVLQLPEELQIMAVDGLELNSYLLGGRERELHILPGERVLTLRYVELFPLNAGDHEVVRSRPAALRFEAKAGERYRLHFEQPRRVEQAREFAKAPGFELRAEGGVALASSQAIKSYAEGSLVDSISRAFESSSPAASSNLDLLKDVWMRASAEERAAFQRWLESAGGQ